MAFTYGFYNSLNGDRRYKAEDFGELVGSLITDGVFENIGSKLFVTAGTGMDINVGTGKAWFDNTWSVNDSVMVLTVPQSDITRPRIDTVVLEVNTNLSARENKIKIVSGEPAVTPVKPNLINNEKLHQHPLAHITVPAAATSIVAANIAIVVGQEDCPFCTGVLQKTDITDLYNQWEDDFTTWFNNLKTQLTDNVVANLQAQIDSISASVTSLETELGGVKTNVTTLQANSGKVLDTSTNQMVQVYGDVVGYSLWSKALNLPTSNITGMFYDAQTKLLYLFSYSYNTSNKTSYYSIYRSSFNPETTTSFKSIAALDVNDGTQHKYKPGFVSNKSVNNRLVHYSILNDMGSQSIICYDLEKQIIFLTPTVQHNTEETVTTLNQKVEIGITSNYQYLLSRNGSQYTISYRTYNATTWASKVLNSNVYALYSTFICGIFEDTLYISLCQDTNQSNIGYTFNLSTGSYAPSNWFLPVSTDNIKQIPLYFDERYIYCILYKGTYNSNNIGNRVFIYDTVTGSSNYSSITGYNGSAAFSKWGSSLFYYLGTTTPSNQAYILIRVVDLNKYYLLRFNTITGVYETQELYVPINYRYQVSYIANTGSYKRMIPDTSITENNGDIIYNGVAINWSKGTLSPIFGVELKTILGQTVNGSYNTAYWPTIYPLYYSTDDTSVASGNEKGSMWNALITTYGITMSTECLGYTRLPGTTEISATQTKIIGKKRAFILSNVSE